MGNKPQLRFPEARVTTPMSGEEVASSMTMTLSVDTSPVVEFVTHPKKDARQAPIQVNNAQVSAYVGQAQRTIFSARSTPDTTVVLKDGAGQTLKFLGYYSNPAYAYGYGTAGMRQAAIHESAALDALVFDVYTAMSVDRWKLGEEEIQASGIADRIRKVTETTIRIWEAERGYMDDSSKEKMVKTKVHAINSELLPLWYKVLDASKSTMGWEEIDNLDDEQKQRLNEVISGALLQQADSFFNVMMRMNSMFQSVWVPDMQPGKMGYFVRRSMLFDNAKSVDVQPIQLSFSGGSSRLLPVTHCIVQMESMSTWKGTQPGTGSMSADLVGAWPETPYRGGRIIRDTGPPWLAKPELPYDTEEFADDRLDIGEYLHKRNGTIKDVKNGSFDAALEVVSQWARDVYNWMALENATATLEIPMDVTWMPGSYMTVKTGDGVLFNGFVQTVRHDLVSDERSSNATTTVMFSNVEASGFALPNR